MKCFFQSIWLTFVHLLQPLGRQCQKSGSGTNCRAGRPKKTKSRLSVSPKSVSGPDRKTGGSVTRNLDIWVDEPKNLKSLNLPDHQQQLAPSC